MINKRPKLQELQLTVGELRKELRKWDQNSFVWVQGCDCYQEAAYIKKLDGKEVLIGNSESALNAGLKK